ncbi:MAG: HD domain-containing protein [Actinobacteria bacterium]|nr:HD domain-containing protein [Actinomycetota bacterium]
MNNKRFKALRYLSIALFVAVLGVCIPFVKWGDLDPARTFGLVAILAVFETWRVQFPWGRPLRLGMAAVLCIIAIRPLPEVVFIFLLGSLLGRAFSRVQRSGEGDFLHIVQRTYIVALSGVVYQVITNLSWDFAWNAYPPNYVLAPTAEGVYFTYFNPAVLHRALVFPIAFLAMALVFYIGEMLTSSAETAMSLGGNWRIILPQHVRQTFPIYLAITGAGALMALYFPRIPWFNFLIFFIPLLLVRLESNRDKELDERYFQTMRVIGDAFDLSLNVPGHSGRVSNLAAEVAREIGISAEETRNIRYAAVLHDIGRMDFEGSGLESGRAEKGAEVLEEVPRLRSIAQIIRYIHPVSEEEAGTTRIPTGSKIIGVVCDYDLIANHPTKPLSSREALEEMNLERGKLYDSIVLRTLSQVVEEQARARRRPEREISQRARVLEEEEMKESLEEIFREEE